MLDLDGFVWKGGMLIIVIVGKNIRSYSQLLMRLLVIVVRIVGCWRWCFPSSVTFLCFFLFLSAHHGIPHCTSTWPSQFQEPPYARFPFLAKNEHRTWKASRSMLCSPLAHNLQRKWLAGLMKPSILVSSRNYIVVQGPHIFGHNPYQKAPSWKTQVYATNQSGLSSVQA